MADDDLRSPSRPEDEPVLSGATPVSPQTRLQDGAADLAASDRPAEAFTHVADTPVQERSPKRSILPVLLTILGAVIVVLLLGTLYTLYNPPETDAAKAARSDIDALRQRVAAMEARPQQTVDLGPVDQKLNGVSADLAKIRTELAATTSKADAAAQGSSVASLQATVAALPKVDLGPIEEKVAAVGTQVSAVSARLEALDKRLVPLEAYFNAPKTTAQVTEVRQNGSAAETRAAPLAVLAQGVLAALDQGRPFSAEMEALGRLGVDEATLAPLKAVAGKGAPTRAELLSGFEATQDRLVVAASPVETGSALDRMMANAASLVTIKRTGAAKGADAGAVSSRIDADLKRGDLAAALTEWETLPEASKAASNDWAAGLKERVAAEAAARSVETRAVTALAAAP